MDANQEKHTAIGQMIGAIEASLRCRGTLLQRGMCATIMMILSFANLPGGYYCCQTAMFAVLVRQGFCVPFAFAGAAAGFAVHFLEGNLIGCWQLPCAAMLWLLCGAWVRREARGYMAAAVFLAVSSVALIADVSSAIQAGMLLLTAAFGAGISLLYDGAALCIVRREELDGDTRPLCIMAVCASITAALTHLPYGAMVSMAFCAYLTLEHAYIGGSAQAVLCAGATGGVLSLSLLRVEPCAMLLCGGFLAGQIRAERRPVTAMLMTLGMVSAAAVLGVIPAESELLFSGFSGFLPFLVFSSHMRAPIVGLIEHLSDPEMTQSEAIAVRCAAMIHAWARLYEDTARMMQGLLAEHKEQAMAQQCIGLLYKTSAAAHQVCERTLSQIHPDDEAYRALRYALVHAGREEVRVAYALEIGGRLETLLLKPESMAPASLAPLVSRACGVPMRPCIREGLLCTQALFEQTPPMMLEVGAALRSRSGEEVSGDGYASRALPGGRHMLALSDGMGSGEDAMQQSHMALSLLVESLKAGYTRTQALDVINALMLMCMGRELYATMDLCVIDLHSGEAAFEKLGACTSYIVRNAEVRAVGADTLPVGVVPDVEAKSSRLTLAVGDVIVMMSDGVQLAFAGGEEALREAIARLSWLHPQAIGERLIAQAVADGEAKDDMAVLCARVGRTQLE